MQEVDQDVALFEALTRVLVGVAWDSAHAAPVGVTFPQIRLLLVLRDLGRVSSSRLAEVLGVNASSVTRLADKLQARGYLDRGTDERNRSVVTLEVTDAGREAVVQVLDRRHAALEAVLDRLAPDQRRAAADAARGFIAAAVAEPTVATSGPSPL
ncbi:MAG TPA: MarR family transcriptional regulator [Pseudonocardiaceae bacterium]|jgi:DNA-binding MarR family transcriptional regulator|nr:MarR family transcriptional regulator [Pseudonocardiaceae bacterium]